MTKYTILIISILSMIFAETSITGQVFDEKGNPLSFAVITNESNKNWVIADENGLFNFDSNLDLNDTLTVSRYGYESKSVTAEKKSFIGITLFPSAIKGEPITVIGNSDEFFNQISNTYLFNSNNSNYSNLFDQIPGINLRSYGGNAGNKSISTNGGQTANTKILLGNIDITSAQNGETDISQIPEVFVQHATIANSPGIFYGSGAPDAAVKINPNHNRTFLSAKYGSYDFKSIDGNYSKNFGNISINLAAGYLSDEGNYKYNLNEIELERENNDIERIYYSLSGNHKISSKSNISLFYLDSKQERGSAGPTSWLSPFARRNDRLQLGNLNYKHLNKTGYSKVQLNIRKSIENFVDDDPYWPMKSEHIVWGNSLNINHFQNIYKDIKSNFLYELKQEKIESTDVGNQRRYTHSFATEVYIPTFFKSKIIPAMRIDKGDDSKVRFTESVKLSNNIIKYLNVELSIGTGFKNPSFNDMYWNPGGNPDLNPEESWYQSFKMKYNIDQNLLNNIYIDISNRFTDNLIQWTPIDDSFAIWTPLNIASSHRTNFTIGGQYQFVEIPIQIASHLTYQKTEDIDLKKPLLYAPDIIGFIGLNYILTNLNIGLQAHYTGERIASYGYPDDVNLPGYWLASSLIQYTANISNQSLSFIIEIDNILDKEYMSINGYPEPGRTFKIGLIYTL